MISHISQARVLQYPNSGQYSFTSISTITIMFFQAIQALKQYQSAATRKALTDILENEQCFYKVRIEASMCLAKVGLELLCLSFTVVVKHDFHPAFSHIFYYGC